MMGLKCCFQKKCITFSVSTAHMSVLNLLSAMGNHGQMGGLFVPRSPPICYPVHPYIRKPLALRGLKMCHISHDEG